MKKRKLTVLAFAFGLAGGMMFTGCSDDETSTSQVTVSLKLNMEQANALSVKEGIYTFTNVSTGVETQIPYGSSVRSVRVANATTSADLTDGLYNVAFVGSAVYTYIENVPNAEGVMEEITKTQDVKVQGSRQNVMVQNGNVVLEMEVYVQNPNAEGNFVIAEIFLGGTLNATTGKQYNGDQYVRIYNNSSKTLYADGLIFMESAYMTNLKFDYNPDIMDEAMVLQALAMVPGDGDDYPVLPGESFILCDNAINHTEGNSNSLDLSGADFEWYTISNSASNLDVDNPAVPNLELLYCYTNSIWILGRQGNRAYAIGRLPEGMTAEQYLSGYAPHTYNYVLPTGKVSPDVSRYKKFGNNWILDAVNVSPKNKYVWNLTSPALDMGYTYIGENSTIAENIGKAIVRKVSYTAEDGRKVLQDTNNSTVDFIPSVKATLLP